MIEFVEVIEDTVTLETISSWILKLRLQHGWTRQQLAEHALVSQQTITSLEQGWRLPNLATVLQVLDTFGYELAIREKRDDEKGR